MANQCQGVRPEKYYINFTMREHVIAGGAEKGKLVKLTLVRSDRGVTGLGGHYRIQGHRVPHLGNGQEPRELKQGIGAEKEN